MKSLWNDKEAKLYQDDALAMRVYSSRLLGIDPSLVLHGGGNTSVKAMATDLFSDSEEVLYVKGSGWDLATIEAAGFAAVNLATLKRMASLDQLSDIDMVKGQRAAMMDPSAPNPSVEAILHAIIPFTYVDHTHTDAMVTLSNTPDGLQIIKQLYGDKVLIIPYVMPGFDLAKTVYSMTQDIDWSGFDGMVLMNHGLFTFDDDAKTSYLKMIDLVTQAETYLSDKNALQAPVIKESEDSLNLKQLAHLRKQVSQLMGQAVVTLLDDSETACGFANRDDVQIIANRGPLTPDHVIRTKRLPLIIEVTDNEQSDNQISDSVVAYKEQYEAYFQRNNKSQLTCLDPAPRWGIWKNYGTLAFAKNSQRCESDSGYQPSYSEIDTMG